MRGDDEVLQRIADRRRQLIDDELAMAPAEGERLDQVLGNLPHVDVAAPADEHSAHRSHSTSLASEAIPPSVPAFTIITPVFDPPLGAFRACIDSVLAQTFTDWEWCVVEDCSTRPEVVRELA